MTRTSHQHNLGLRQQPKSQRHLHRRVDAMQGKLRLCASYAHHTPWAGVRCILDTLLLLDSRGDHPDRWGRTCRLRLQEHEHGLEDRERMRRSGCDR
eukprot:4970734-Prymnesium_polylepis.3